MAIGLQKLSAGSGYEYLTRQVAALDATGRGHTTLADYYTAKGESPGRWFGEGLAGAGLKPGDPVTAEQMKLLFGAGLNPVTGGRLGRRYAVYGNEPTPFEAELARRLSAWQDEQKATIPKQVRDQLRTDLAREWFTREYGRAPSGPRELHGFVAKATSHRRTSVAGFDATFTPPKSVSALWAVATPELARAIQAAHEVAVGDALTSAERRVVFTRQGHDGARHAEVRGLLAAVFLHRDSRAGDPNLHTHVAIANKVQTASGDWLAIDARILYEAKVTLSEEYTTSLQARLVKLGLSFVPTGRDGKRPVYEIAGVDPRLVTRWSSRRHEVTARTQELVARFQADHERPPTSAEKLELAQQATLETRQAKHHPRSEAEQRATWRAEAEQVLGPGGIHRVLTGVLCQPEPEAPLVDDAFVVRTAHQVINIVESERSSWTVWHVRSEALRQLRAVGVALELIEPTVEAICGHALGATMSIPIATTRSVLTEPELLRRSDGVSVYARPAAGHFTSQRILWAERRLVDTAGRVGGRRVDANSVTLALLQSLANGEPLNAGQQLLVHEMATSGRRLHLAIAPAGTGKTTAMRALAAAWTTSGGNVIGLAPSAASAEALRTQLDVGGRGAVDADNLAKLVWAIAHREPLAEAVGAHTLVIVDEAGMADTLTLDYVVSWCLDRGASVRLIGDDQQLGAIGAGGVLRDIAAEHGALRLDEAVRFTNPAEAEASLALRTGDTGALGFYLDNRRVHVVDPDAAAAGLLGAWRADTRAGKDALMLAPTRNLVADLNAAARAARLAGADPGREAALCDGNRASCGDVIITRRNNRTLTSGATAWVRNGDRWRVTAVHRDGSLDVQNLRTRGQLTLPSEYVATSVELGYATTIHGAQGVTADVCHGLLSGSESRQQVYTMLSRGREANHAWVQVASADDHAAPVAQHLVEPATATQLLETVISRDDAPVSATTLIAQADDPIRLLGPAVACYLDAIGFAAERHLDQATKDALDAAGQALGLTDADAWPTLRAHLMLIAANGHDPAVVLTQAAALGGLETARDPAAVVDYRLDLTKANTRAVGPLPWLPGIPTQLLDDPGWKSYLSARYVLTRQLGEEAHRAADGQAPAWARHLPGLEPELLADIGLWRAAHNIADSDLRPTGPTRHSPAERRTQRRLDHRLETCQAGIREWTPRVVDAVPTLAGDPRLPVLAAQLATLDKNGHDAVHFLHVAADMGDLPDDHPAAALGYRITNLTKRTPSRTATWERITPRGPEGPRHLEPPPSLQSPTRSPGISF